MLLYNFITRGWIRKKIIFNLITKKFEYLRKWWGYFVKRKNKILFYWEYKLVRSVFLCSKMHLFQNKNEWTNQLKYSIATYYFFLSLRQFSNSISKNDSFLEAIQFWSQFSISAKEVNRWLAKSCYILRNN